MGGTILYKSSLNRFRLNYDSGQVEWYDAGTDTRTRKCGVVCKTIPYFENNPEFFNKTGDAKGSQIIIDGRNCFIYNKALSSSQPLEWVAMDDSGKACGAKLRNGIQFSFSQVETTVAFQDSDLNAALFCQDGSEDCNKQLDIYFIGDQSGSVTQSGFDSEISFMTNMLNLLDVDEESVHVGLTFFSDFAEEIQQLTGNKTRLINTLASKTYKQGSTCISCGLDSATVNFGANGRPGVPKVYVTTTDGKNNFPTPQSEADFRLLEAANKSKAIVAANGGAMVAIGVGSGVLVDELKKFVTNEKYILQVSSFDTLKGITNDVLSSTCEDSDYICDSCPTGFCICGSCIGCPNGCGETGGIINGGDAGANVGMIVGLVIAGVVVLAAAITGVIWYMKNRDKKDTTKEVEERPGTVDIEDRSERYSKLVRKFSTNEDKRVTKPLEE
jgi:hypothetical protein